MLELIEQRDYRGLLDDYPLQFDVEAGDGDGQATDQRHVRLRKQNIPVLKALQLLAIQAGMQLEFSPYGVALVPFVGDADAAFATKDFKFSNASFIHFSPFVEQHAPVTLNVENPENELIELADPESLEFEGFVLYGSPVYKGNGGIVESTLNRSTWRNHSPLPAARLALTTGMEIHGGGIPFPIFSSRREPHESLSIHTENQLTMWGISLPENAVIEWSERSPGNDSSGTLSVTAPKDHLVRITTLLNELRTRDGSQTVSLRNDVHDVPLEAFDGSIASLAHYSTFASLSADAATGSPKQFRTDDDTQFAITPFLEGEAVRLRIEATSAAHGAEVFENIVHADQPAVLSLPGQKDGILRVFVLEAIR